MKFPPSQFSSFGLEGITHTTGYVLSCIAIIFMMVGYNKSYSTKIIWTGWNVAFYRPHPPP